MREHRLAAAESGDTEPRRESSHAAERDPVHPLRSLQLRGRSASTLLERIAVRSSAAALVVLLGGCGHWSTSSLRHSRVAAAAPSSVAPPPMCRLPTGEEPNCSCDDGDCAARLGVLYSDARRDGEALRLFERSCDRGSALGCNNLGTFVLAGRAVAADASRAARLFERACRLRDPSACYNLGVVYQDGNGVARDPVLAAELLQQACALGMAHACTSLGIVFARGSIGPADELRARAMFDRACDRGDGEGCAMLRGGEANGN